LALQEPRLTSQYQPSTDPRSPRLRNPDQLRRGARCPLHPSPKWGQSWTPIEGQSSTPIDKERKTMKASQFSDAQKAFILRQGNDGVPVADICRKAGISQATYFNWKKKYEGMQPPEMRRLKQLEDENAKLKKIVADLSLDREMLQDVIRRKL
jgi:putative transposase